MQGLQLPDLPRFIEDQQTDRSLEHNKTLEPLTEPLSAMAVGAHIGAWLQDVQEALNTVLLLMEIEIAAKSGA